MVLKAYNTASHKISDGLNTRSQLYLVEQALKVNQDIVGYVHCVHTIIESLSFSCQVTSVTHRVPAE